MTIEIVPEGHLTSPRGFLAGGVSAGIKSTVGALDLGLLFSERDCAAAGVFTTNLVRSAPVSVSESRVQAGPMRGVVANSGCANAPFADQGITDAEEMAALAAAKVGVNAEQMAVASTGVTGVLMPMDKVRNGIPHIDLSADGGPNFARSIMTTDTYAKEFALVVKDGAEVLYTVGGCAKGSGMIHPNMATMLAYVCTDAAVEPAFLRETVHEVADQSFNLVSVDGDTSCSDTFLVFANGAADGPEISEGTPEGDEFAEALLMVATHLSRLLARDGEGAQHLITVEVAGAESSLEARQMARTVALSSLVKTAVAGNDPNWGRVLVAAGRSGARIEVKKATLILQGEVLFDKGEIIGFDEADLHEKMKSEEVKIEVNLHLGDGAGTAWGCDLTTDYVHINGDYRT